MPARAIWKGALSIGGTSIPVKLYSAVREHSVTFHLLHDKDHVRLQQQMVCSKDRQPVPREQQVKGFEAAPGSYVLVSNDEIDALSVDAGRDVEVLDFVTPDEVDQRYYERPYYLGPDGDNSQYLVLLKALAESERIGICRWFMRKRYYLGALKAEGEVIMLAALRYADEVIPVEALELPDAKLSERERKTACDLVEALAGEFQPEQFQNEYLKTLRKLIERKAKGEKIPVKRVKAPKPTHADNILETLEASLKDARGRKAAA